MGQNHHQNEKEVRKSVDEDDERQIRINRNLTRFLAEQASQQRLSKRRQYYNHNINPSADVTNTKPLSNNPIPNRSMHYGMKLSEEYHQIQRKADQQLGNNLNHENFSKHKPNKIAAANLPSVAANQRSLIKQATINPRLEEERQNILNNNITNHVPSKIPDLNLKNSLNSNQRNKRCTMRVSKLIGRSLTFSCMC